MNAIVVEGLVEKELRTIDGFRYIHPDIPVKLKSYSWGVDRIDQNSLPLSLSYNPSFRGCGVDVYIVDTGIIHEISKQLTLNTSYVTFDIFLLSISSIQKYNTIST